MRFEDLAVGNNFTPKGIDRKYKKIRTLEDKWGNLYVAVDADGELATWEDFPDDSEVEETPLRL